MDLIINNSGQQVQAFSIYFAVVFSRCDAGTYTLNNAVFYQYISYAARAFIHNCYVFYECGVHVLLAFVGVLQIVT